MFDLLSTLPTSVKVASMNPLQVVEDDQGVYVRGLQSHLAQNEPDALNMLFEVSHYHISIRPNNVFIYELSNFVFH